jgi:hypothetical protein
VREAAGVQLDRVRAEVVRGAHGVVVGVDEQARAHPRGPQLGELAREARRVARDVEPALGGHLLPPLGDERDLVRPQPARERDHRVGAGDLEVEHRAHLAREPLDVVVLHVAAVLAQVGRDAVGAGGLALARGPHGVGLVAAAGLPERGDVVDVDVEPLVRGHAPWAGGRSWAGGGGHRERGWAAGGRRREAVCGR